MIEWIVSSSILIAAVLLLRLIFQGKISKRLQYALWGLVVLRLLIPISLAQSAASVANLFTSMTQMPVVQAASGSLTSEDAYDLVFQEVLAEHNITSDRYSAYPRFQREAILQKYEPEVQAKLDTYEQAYDTARLLNILWFAGFAGMSLCLLGSNLFFAVRLKRTRKRLPSSASLPVFQTDAVQTPCLVGLFCTTIYLPDTAVDEKSMAYILAHEQTHCRHGDHIWALVRCVCLALHWYNPLVWIAIKVSRVDCELACDEGTLAKLGDGSRESYGRTLIEMSCARPSIQDYLLTATTMTGDKKNLYRRIQAIAAKQTFILGAVAALAVSSLVLVSCTFTGAKAGATDPSVEVTQPTETTTSPETTPSTTISPETTVPTEPPYHEDIMAVPMTRLMGMLYVLDKDEDSFTQQLPEGYVYLCFCHEGNNTIPAWNGASRHIPTYTELYASPEEPDYVYYDTGNGYQRLIRAALVENEVSKNDSNNWMPENYTLAFFTALFWEASHNPYNQAAGQVFTQPEGVDLYKQFYNGFLDWGHYEVPLTEGEKEFLAARGWGKDKPMRNAERFPVSAMDEQLQRFFGITFDQSWKVGLHKFEHYREENQCYYNWRSDFRGYSITILSIEHDPGSDRYHITYECYGLKNRMTLIRTDGIFLIYANVLAR